MERGVKRLVAKAVSPEFREFNFTVFYGGEAKGEAIAETAQTLPMFAERRVVLVKRSAALPAAALDILSEYIREPSPSTCLIFQGEKIDQRKKFFTELKKHGNLIEYKRPYENQLGSFIREEAAGYGKRLEPAAAEMLGCLVGNNLQELVAQIEKVALYVGDRQTVKVEDVKAVACDTRVDSVFDLANYLGEQDLGKSLRSLQTLIRDGEAPLMVLAMVTRHFRQLWRVREQMERGIPAAEIGKAAGIHPYFARSVIAQAGGYQLTDFRGIFEEFYTTDLALKTSGGKALDLLERLIMNLCGRSGKIKKGQRLWRCPFYCLWRQLRPLPDLINRAC